MRELENVIERAVVLARGARVELAELPDTVVDRSVMILRGDDAAVDTAAPATLVQDQAGHGARGDGAARARGDAADDEGQQGARRAHPRHRPHHRVPQAQRRGGGQGGRRARRPGGAEAAWPSSASSRYDVADGVCTVTLSRPDRLNAVTSIMIDELIEAFDRADADDAVRAVIVTGAGRAFCAGADLSGGGRTFDRAARERGEAPGEHRDGGGRVALRIFDMKKPVIAAINGPAVGFGITMTLPMDIRIASTAARIGFVFARRGVVPEACSTWFLPRLVGMARAAEWVFTGRVFSAEEAREGGLVSRVVAPRRAPARRRARWPARSRTNTSAMSVALSRQMMWRLLGADHPMEAHRLDSRLHGLDGPRGRRARRRLGVPRQAPGALHAAAQRRHAALLSLVDRPRHHALTRA